VSKAHAVSIAGNSNERWYTVTAMAANAIKVAATAAEQIQISAAIPSPNRRNAAALTHQIPGGLLSHTSR